jgi:dienelactone hydrolase
MKILREADIARSGTRSYGSTMVTIRIDSTPERPALDTELRILVTGLPPGRPVTMRAGSTDPAGQIWTSAATFTAGDDGVADLTRDAPTSGSYQQADAMGLVWSMQPAGSRDPAQARDRYGPVPLRLTAELDGTKVATKEVSRDTIPDGLTRVSIRENGLVGVLFHPAGEKQWPGVMQLGGSEGGLHEDDAALLAAHGFTVLALAYYGLPGLPATLTRVPVEYFGAGLSYLGAHPAVAPGGIALMGVSKGGEAALLAGATYPRAVRSVISIVGSAVHTSGICGSVTGGDLLEILSTPVPSWTYQGKDLPYLPYVVTARIKEGVAAGGPVRLDWASPELGDAPELSDAAIPVERIGGPVLLIDGEDGGTAFQKVATRRVRDGDRCRHIVYARAGHLIAATPYRPTTQSVFPGPGVDFDWGGNPAADAAARVAAWREIRAFLTS